jgi:hypothetical protein
MRATDLVGLIGRIVAAVPQAVQTVEHIKAAKGRRKEAVVEAIPGIIGQVEYVANKDLLNDPAVIALRDALLEAEVAVMHARDAYKAGLLAKAAA